MKASLLILGFMIGASLALVIHSSFGTTECATAQEVMPPAIDSAPAPDEAIGEQILRTLLEANAAGGTVDESIEDQLQPLFRQLTPDVVFQGPGPVGGVAKLPQPGKGSFQAASC